jgi:hypothetical protein
MSVVPAIWEAKAGGSFETSLCNIARPHVKKKKKKEKKEPIEVI